MSAVSSSGAEWFSRIERIAPPSDLPRRPDDPRLGEVIAFWTGDVAAITAGRAVLIGFPQDEGVQRNGGRPGAAEAPRQIRHWLHRLCPWDCETHVDLGLRPPLDLGDIRIEGSLEQTQQALGEVVGAVLDRQALPIVLGGGHETAFGHYLGYVHAGHPVGIINIDAHLDIRPCQDGHGHSGSPFRQAMEHPAMPLPGERYACLGVAPQATSRNHWEDANQRGCQVRTVAEVRGTLIPQVRGLCDAWSERGATTYLSIDADGVLMGDVPGVSAPSVNGLAGAEVLALARSAGQQPTVSSFDIVEINPHFDRDGQSARWAALLIWHFLIGLAAREFA